MGSFNISLTFCLFGNIHEGNLRDGTIATDEGCDCKGPEGRGSGSGTVSKNSLVLKEETFGDTVLGANAVDLLSRASVRDFRILYS